MNKIFFIFVVIALSFACDNGLTQKEQCIRKVNGADGTMDTETVAFTYIIIDSGYEGKTPKELIDSLLLAGLNYQNQIRKCKNKSEYLPGDL